MQGESPLAGLSVLLVDDDDLIRDALGMLLEPDVASYRAVASAEEGLEALQLQVFDLLVTDYRLPAMNGLDLLRRAGGLLQDTFVVFVTAHGSDELFAQATALGAGACVHKPLTAERLEQALAHS